MSLDYSIVDLVAAFVVLASTVYATWKGFISETLSIVAWAVAAFASLYLGPWAGDRLYALISPPWLASLAGYAIVFLVVLIPLSLASSRLAQSVQHSPVGFIDRVLGMAFGVVRGVVVLGLAYLVFTAFVPIRSQPKWLTTARALPLIQSSSEVLLSLVPNSHAQDVVPLTRKAQNLPAGGPEAAAPDKPKSVKHVTKGYGVGDRRALDRLFEATGNGGSGKP
ncbi:MAG TPA: CvpA family protein [Rhizomicrobium sp.]|jgi:membrane protein required for colicin V production|nr:CvpA family protein [Rhizomicrobium sp.]